MIHYLDDLRHFLAFTWTIWTWVGNISAGIVVAAVASIFWPPIRRRVHAFMDAKLGDVHAVGPHHSPPRHPRFPGY